MSDPHAESAWLEDRQPWASGIQAENIIRAQKAIRVQAERHRVDVELLNALVSVECGFNPGPNGRLGEGHRVGDLGMMTPGFNLASWAQRLDRALDRFGDEDQAIAALIWGEANVELWERWNRPMPAAARRYVDRVQRERNKFARSSWWR